MRFLRLPAVLIRVGMRRSAWYARVADGRAPGPIKLGGRLAVWSDEAIEAWQREVAEHGERINAYPLPAQRATPFSTAGSSEIDQEAEG